MFKLGYCKTVIAIVCSVISYLWLFQRGSRTDSCLSFVRVEFNGCVLGDSQKLDVPVDKDVVYNFSCSFECSEVAHTLDDVAHKPVIREDFCLVSCTNI